MSAHRSRLLPIALLTLLAAAGVATASDESYGYFRTVEGAGTVTPAQGDETEPAELNQPVLTGDRIEVAPRSRLEIVLADRSRLRLDAESRLLLESLAFSSDASARTTQLRLLSGTAQIAVGEEALGDELPRLDLGNATVYLQDVGEYRLSTDGESWSEIVVRQGYAEVVTERGSTVVRSGEAAQVTGERWTSTRLGPAPRFDALERWAADLDEGGARRAGVHVDRGLSYSAASLDDYGSWVYTDDSWAWRPRVEADWRPYWRGRWCHTPSGLTWVSSEPWGWVPYHYGTWSLSTSYGWVWLPGRTYSPAWVYWYWGDRWAGWCPMGYYTRYYRGDHWGRGFRFGVYGSVGGDLDLFAHWNFGPVNFLFDRHRRGQWHGGRDLGHELGQRGLPRGVLTTDTRGLDPDRLRRGYDPRELAAGRGERGDRGDRNARGGRGVRGNGPGSPIDLLPDVTDFVARKPGLSPEVRRRIVAQEPDQGAIADTPLAAPGARTVHERPERPDQPVRATPGWRLPREGGGEAAEPARPRLNTGGSAPLLDERPARRARPVRPEGSSPVLDERPAALPEGRPADHGASAAVPIRRPRSTPSDSPALDERPNELSTPTGRQNWRQRGPHGGGGSSVGSDGAPVEAQPWRTPTVNPPVVRRPRGGPVEPQPAEAPPVVERPARRTSPRWSPPPSEAPAAVPGSSGETSRPLVERPARRSGDRTSTPTAREWSSPSPERPPVRRVIDGVRQNPPAAPRVAPAPRAPRPSPAPTTSSPRPERSREGSGRRERKADPPPERD